ncbi:dTDP-4-dehydrorhamnose reductase [Psychrosphaera aestuarii]|uniref:dTDP-4-dehydrorhamnose reductase n=1 Tax=Psychrosphaera aestuarii TaxID=1266052 RepID=UPI001B31D16C|nr:dTDP-4-dehydrorhamnose reductase [Psychrosphaera aestuarii]
MNAVIIGRNGQVAWELQQTVPKNTNILVLGSQDVDITDLSDLTNALAEHEVDVIINASAYTAVDKAETDKENAFLINEQAVRNLAVVAKNKQARFIHISTDFVFDGEHNQAYKTTDMTNPVSVYGASKLAGEQAAFDEYRHNTVVVRTSWVYSSHGNNFVKTMLRLMEEKEQLSVVADQIGCPTYARGLAEFLWVLSSENKVESIYNWSDLGVASWYDFAIAIQSEALEQGLLSKRIPISPIATEDYPTPAKRPKFSLLDHLSSSHVYQAKHWQLNLAQMLKALL